jgi:hypothetical protein
MDSGTNIHADYGIGGSFGTPWDCTLPETLTIIEAEPGWPASLTVEAL